MERFKGTARYEVVRELGAGGMGVVYEAIDRERDGRRVALKVLQRQDADSLVRLKREFRALADVRHKNLASLYELAVEGETWFFTLELVEGVDFLEWVRPGAKRLAEAPTGQLDVTMRAGEGAVSVVDHARLEDAFSQLVEGVGFLHSSGRLHRDLKPSNVLVTKEGRVVILDFGLVLELEGVQSISEARGSSIVGTAAYMAPEQAGSGVVGPPADLYALGVMLFQALTGRVPFDGVAVQVLLEKQRRPAPAPRDVVPGVPEKLDRLATGLLQQDAAARLSAQDVLATLGRGAQASRPAPRLDSSFVGRGKELEQLQAALQAARSGSPRVVRILGASGIGKSALVRRFVEGLDGVVLQGRCYERETVPFKALDSVVDALARHLSELPDAKVDAVLPRDASAVARMFPVLGRVTAFRQAPVREVKEPSELRRRAVLGLRELFGRMSDRAPLVLVIDDAQWGDVDSTLVLDELLRPPDAPALLLVIVARAASNPLEGLRLTPVDLSLEGLSPAEVEKLLATQVSDAARREAIAREAGGNPFLAEVLASSSGEVKLEDVVLQRIDGLSKSARALLEVVAIASGPVEERVAAKVAGVEASDVDTLPMLKSANLVRGVHGDRLEAWHDRIREAVVSRLSAERARELHARLADAMTGSADFELIAWHLASAGLVEQAAQATIEAARAAVRQLAFERAAVLFERSLQLLPGDDRRRRDLRVELAEAWAMAGRGAVSASAYELAVNEPGEAGLSRIELQRRAAEQLLRSGHIDAGLHAVNQVLGAMGMTLAKTPRRALWALAFRRLHIWLRGRSFVETAEKDAPAELIQRIDACWSVSMGLSMVDTIRGASFQARQLLLALEAGEPHRVTRALAAEAAFVATGGLPAERRAAKLVSEARELAERLGDPLLIGLVDFCAGLTRFCVGKWREAAQFTALAERRFSDAGAMLSWESANSRLFTVWSLFYLGDVAGLSVRIPALTREAEERGDRYAVTSLRCGLANVALLAAGDARAAREAVDAAMAGWSSRSFHFQHYWAALSQTMIDLYEGQLDQTLGRLEQTIASLRESQLMRIQNVRIEARALLGRVLVALGRLDEARDQSRLLREEKAGWADAFASLIEGLAGDEKALSVALEGFDRHEMALFSGVTRLRLGQKQGAQLGEANTRAALAWMQTQAVKDPARLADALAPLPRK
ncbi:MAG: protein kinase [Myxococcaceae bacterium]